MKSFFQIIPREDKIKFGILLVIAIAVWVLAIKVYNQPTDVVFDEYGAEEVSAREK